MIKRLDDSTFVLDNGLVCRTLTVNENGLHTSSFVNKQSGTQYVYAKECEFSFTANKKSLSSFSTVRTREVDGVTVTTTADFVFSGFDIVKNSDASETLVLHLQNSSNLNVDVCYKIYQNIAGVRKHLEITNSSDAEITIENLVIDNLMLAPAVPADCRMYHDFDRDMPPAFATESPEDVIRIHNHTIDEGCFFGSNVPGILRYFLYFPHWCKVNCAYNMGGAYFRKTLAPQEKLVTHDSIFAVYCGKFESADCAESYRKLVRANLPPLPYKEGIMYCTWLPFLHNISEELIDTLAVNASDMGFDYLVIDDGWFKTESDWQVDETKFPNGLEKVSEKIRNAGLKFGLWFNIGTDYGAASCDDSLVAQAGDGSLKCAGANSMKVMCFGSDYRFHVTERLAELAEKYHVSYFKLDFSCITSPYNMQEWGCHSTEHRFHKNYSDSIFSMYEGLRYVRETLKKRFPDLVIDFSFENFGTARPNVAALEYSEIHHVSNLSANKPFYQKISNVRHTFYNWLKVLPPERILNGLLSIQGDNGVEYFLTSLAGAPLVAGDLRQLSPEIKTRITKCCSAFKRVTENGPLTAFEVVCDTLDRDGFIRKSDDNRAILCLFNRSSEPWKLDLSGFINAENGSSQIEVAPKDCAMYISGT